MESRAKSQSSVILVALLGALLATSCAGSYPGSHPGSHPGGHPGSLAPRPTAFAGSHPGSLAPRPTAFAPTIQFSFYLHDNLLTSDPSAEVVTLPQESAPLNSFFGALIVFDDSMTTLPAADSLEIARGRGLYLFDANDNKGAAILFVWTAQFNEKSQYGNGTTLSFMGFDRTTDETRYISVVGGTGFFRYARGEAQITTYSLVGAAAVLHFNVTVMTSSY